MVGEVMLANLLNWNKVSRGFGGAHFGRERREIFLVRVAVLMVCTLAITVAPANRPGESHKPDCALEAIHVQTPCNFLFVLEETSGSEDLVVL